ncbi:MAG: hypothetical protein H0V24_17335 [Chloroflexia bacterium]|nr:hypothetical protein [Chloroflexia bacterium]MDQ3411451.1 hypothetical protein [Chloroflexota bacterium]
MTDPLTAADPPDSDIDAAPAMAEEASTTPWIVLLIGVGLLLVLFAGLALIAAAPAQVALP